MDTTKDSARGFSVRSIERACRVVAIFFMPPLSATYVFLALSFASGLLNTFFFLAISFFFATLLEVSSLLAYVQFSKKDANVQDRADRPALFAIAIFSYLAGFVALRYLQAPFTFSALMFAYFANTILAALITRYVTKVSIHTWGITGPSVAILYSLGAVGFLLMLILGVVVGSTRVRLGYHSTGQVALSFLASIPLTWFVVYVMPRVLPTIFG